MHVELSKIDDDKYYISIKKGNLLSQVFISAGSSNNIMQMYDNLLYIYLFRETLRI